MTQLAAKARAVEPKPPWNISNAWPQEETVWRVEPVLLSIELLIAQGRPAERLCRALSNIVPGAYWSRSASCRATLLERFGSCVRPPVGSA